MDSGATTHMCADLELFTSLRRLDVPLTMLSARGNPKQVTQIGDVTLTVVVSDKEKVIELKDVLYVDDLRYNMLSIATIVEKGLDFQVSHDKAYVMREGTVMLEGSRGNNRLPLLNVVVEKSNSVLGNTASIHTKLISSVYTHVGRGRLVFGLNAEMPA